MVKAGLDDRSCNVMDQEASSDIAFADGEGDWNQGEGGLPLFGSNFTEVPTYVLIILPQRVGH